MDADDTKVPLSGLGLPRVYLIFIKSKKNFVPRYKVRWKITSLLQDYGHVNHRKSQIYTNLFEVDFFAL